MKKQTKLVTAAYYLFLLIIIAGSCKTSTVLIQVPAPPNEKNMGMPEPVPIVNLGTNIPTLFSENLESSSPDIKYFGRTLGSASFSFADSRINVVVDNRESVNSKPLGFNIAFSNASKNPEIEGVELSKAKTNLLLSTAPASKGKELPSYNTVRYNQLYDGITVEYSANGRILYTKLIIRPGYDYRQIRWNYSSLESVLIDSTTANVRFSIKEGDSQKSFVLGKPRVTQHGKQFEAEFLYDKRNGFSLDLAKIDSKNQIVVEFELMFSPHFNDYSGVQLKDNSIMVVGSTPGFSTKDNYTEDIFVARLNEEGNKILQATFIGGSSNERASGISVANTGELIVVGKTNSTDFPGADTRFNRNKGYDLCLFKLSKDAKRLIASKTWGGTGDDSGTAILIKDNGNIIVTGEAGANLPLLNTKLMRFNTLFPQLKNIQACKRQYYIAEFDKNLSKPNGVQFEAPELPSVTSISIWEDLQAVPTIGIYTIPAKPASCTSQSFQMSNFQHVDFTTDPYIDMMSPFTTPTGWGYHALRWKALHAGSPYTYAPSLASSVPISYVSCGDESFLNVAEIDAFTPPDPGGGWECHNTYTVEELALAAAFFMDRWNSPIYTVARKYSDPLYGEYFYDLGIEKVTFCIVDPNNNYDSTNPTHQLSNLCSFNTTSPGSLTVSCTNAGSFYYEPKEFVASQWGLPLVYHLSSVTMDATTASYPNPNAWYWSGADYIGDPPEEEAHLIPLIVDANKQVKDWMVKRITLESVAYNSNVFSSPKLLKCYVRLNDIQYD